VIRPHWNVRQRPNHSRLLGRPTVPAWALAVRPPLDAIIVPAARPAGNLRHAMLLARAAGTHLVVLCSKEAHPDEVIRLAAEQGIDAVTAVTVPREYRSPLFDFETTRWIGDELPSVCDVRDSDLSMKRNIGLALARLSGWRRVFFMDDDIRQVTAPDLQSTVAALGGTRGYRSVGMTITGFPDNSVVCHARRGTGKYQGVFVSGSVLAVDTVAHFDFFPDIYNEDWLFFYRDAAQRRLGRTRGTASQNAYDPFADPRRAAGQEFGDTIAEGLYALLDIKKDDSQADQEFWSVFLDARRKFIEDIEARQDKTPEELWKQIGLAVQAARLCLSEITPDLCCDYLECWRRDRENWAQRISAIPLGSAPDIAQALAELSLSHKQLAEETR